MDKRTLVAIGGGEIREKTTLPIDEYISELAKKHANGKRATGVFIGTASHDSLPYFNSFRKIYTSIFDIKADLVLLTKKDIPMWKITSKIETADLLYIGGGDTIFMLNTWKETGVDKLILDAYNRGVPCAGLSAGAICWFSDIYTDSAIIEKSEGEYSLAKGLGVIDSLISPHYEDRLEFDELTKNFHTAYGIMNNAALVFENEIPTKTLSSGGDSFLFKFGEKEKLVFPSLL